MALIVTKQGGFTDEGTGFSTPSIYVWVVPTFAGKKVQIATHLFLNKEKKDAKAALKLFQLPKNSQMNCVFDCQLQTIQEAHELLKSFYESNGFTVEITDL